MIRILKKQANLLVGLGLIYSFLGLKPAKQFLFLNKDMLLKLSNLKMDFCKLILTPLEEKLKLMKDGTVELVNPRILSN